MNGIWVVARMGNSLSLCKRKDDVSQGPPKKRKGDIMQIHGVINTPPVLGENAPSSSRQGTHVVRPLHFMIEPVLHNSFSWVFWSYMLKLDINLWASLSNSIILFVFLLHHLNQLISKQTLTFGIHFATSKIGERKICQLALIMFIHRNCKDCNFQRRLWVTPKWFKSNNIII